ncbi:hypothetical protein GCM10009092_26900 [Bowmanella denitrificans]|uniref:Uncharacterized protein n=1 Tax=Bowmanella denitrificans TaxID=366582 RepID=A0ABN0XDV1_9ALTE
MTDANLTSLSTEELLDMFEHVDDQRHPQQAQAIFMALQQRGALNDASLQARYSRDSGWLTQLWQLPLKLIFFPLSMQEKLSLTDARAKVARLATYAPQAEPQQH